MAETKVSDSKLTCLVANEDLGVAYIADRGGNCFIYDTLAVRNTSIKLLKKNPPSCRKTINTGSKSIRGLDVDFAGGNIFMSSFENGYIYKYKLADPESIVIPF